MDSQILLLASIATIISTLAPLLWSIYKETRRVLEWNIFWYGLASILFGMSYLAVELLPINENVRLLGAGASIGYGVFLIYAFISKKPAFITDEEAPSLIFSGKTNGSFQLALLIPTVFPYIQIIDPTTYNVISIIIGTFVVSWVCSFVIFAIRNGSD